MVSVNEIMVLVLFQKKLEEILKEETIMLNRLSEAELLTNMESIIVIVASWPPWKSIALSEIAFQNKYSASAIYGEDSPDGRGTP